MQANGTSGVESSPNDKWMYHLCFDPSEFKDEEEFSAARFVVEKKNYVPIDTLIKDLTAFREHLQDEVVHLVNTDVYDTFLSVTNKLYQRENDLLRLQAPLQDMANRVLTAKKKLEFSKEKVEEKLKKLQHLESCKTFTVQKLKLTVVEHKLRKALEAFHTEDQPLSPSNSIPSSLSPTIRRANGLESPLHPSPAVTPPPEDFTGCKATRMRLLAHIAQLSNQLETDERLWIPVTDDHKTEQVLICGRLNQLRTHVTEVLETEYIDFLKAYRKAAVEHEERCKNSGGDISFVAERSIQTGLQICLQAYNELERQEEAVKVFRETICNPSAEEAVTWSAARMSRDSPEAMEQLFAQPIRMCCKYWKGIIDIGHEVGIPSLILAMWQAYSDTISKRLHFLFESGNPLFFNRRYNAAHRLAGALEDCCNSVRALHELRHEMKLWESRWNLDVYFKMRELNAQQQVGKWLQLNKPEGHLLTAETVQSLEQDKQEQPDTIYLNVTDFSYAPSAAIYSALTWLVSPAVFLFPLGNRFLETCLQLIQGLAKWHARFLVDQGYPLLDTSGDVVRGSSAGDAGQQQAVLLALHRDVSTLRTLLRSSFKPAFLMYFEGAPSEALAAVDIFLDVMLTATSKSAHELSSALTSIVALQCVGRMSFINDIIMTCMTNRKQMPQQATQQGGVLAAEDILSPLASFRDGLRQKHECPTELIDGWSQEIVAVVTTSYKRSVREARIKVEKRMQAFKVDKSGKEGQMPPTDKLVLQCYHDVQAFGKVLTSSYGITCSTFPPYQRLLDSVKRGAWLKGDIVEEPEEDLGN